jgi:lysozyme family protein
MTDLFTRCIDVVLRNEGGYVNDHDDPGGETKYGISKRAFPDVDIQGLTIEEAKDIYFEKYWKPLNIDTLTDANAALQIFDFAVNAGLSRAVKTAQRLSGTYVDGKIGPNTINAINNMGPCFLARYIYARKEFYQYLAKIKPAQSKFLQGWLNRVEHTKLYA